MEIPVLVNFKKLELTTKQMPLFTFGLIKFIFDNIATTCKCDGCCTKKCLAESWSTFSHLLLAIYGAQLSKQTRMTFTISSIDFRVRRNVVSSIRYLTVVKDMKLNWTPLAAEDEWSNRWTLKTSCFSVLHEDQQAQIMTTLKCWRFRETLLASLPREILMEILILIARPPFVFCNRCFCCNSLVSGHFQCNWCADAVFFCNTECQKKAKGIHALSCDRNTDKRAKTDPPMAIMEHLPPVLSDRDSNLVDMIEMRYPKDYHFISKLADQLKAASNIQ